MVKFRNVRVKMRGGGSRIQRAMVLASGKLRFVKNIAHSKSRVSKPKTTKTRSVKHTTKKKRTHHNGRSLLQTAERLGQLGALVAPGAYRAMEVYNAEHNGGRAVIEGVSLYGGMQDGRFQLDRLTQAWAPVVVFTLAKVGAHKLIGMIRRA